MSRSIIVSTVVVGVLGTFVLAAAQIGGHGAHGSGGPASAAHRRMDAALEERNKVIAQGLGAGLAFPADQNDYPGPRHVLELKDVLRLTAQQEPIPRYLWEDANWQIGFLRTDQARLPFGRDVHVRLVCLRLKPRPGSA